MDDCPTIRSPVTKSSVEEILINPFFSSQPRTVPVAESDFTVSPTEKPIFLSLGPKIGKFFDATILPVELAALK